MPDEKKQPESGLDLGQAAPPDKEEELKADREKKEAEGEKNTGDSISNPPPKKEK